MGINHCCTHIAVAKKFLDCPYIVSVFQQVSCKRMTKGVATCVFIDASNITKGIKNNNVPSAETAVKIAQVLGVSVEYLVNGTETSKSP